MCRYLLFTGFFFFSFYVQAQEKDSILSPCVSEIFVPNSFSGNGDSVNDVLKPIMAGSPETYSFTVYNRWGESVFQTEKPEEGWDGKFKDQAQPMDVYLWTITFTCKETDKKYSFTGDVTLMR